MRSARLSCRGLTLAVLLLHAAPAAAQTELRNDNYRGAGDAAFVGGFVSGEIGAARFVPVGPCTITKLQLLFGGAPTTQNVTVHIYRDSATTTTPGSELMTPVDVQLTGNDSALQEIDLSDLGHITVAGPFRVGFEWHHDGYPSLAHDTDGRDYPDRNFVDTSGGWETAQSAGITGDWVIRAFVVYDFDAGVAVDAGVQLDAGPQPDGGFSSCVHDTDCPAKYHCEWTRVGDDGGYGACHHNCISDLSCPGNATCNSLGRCVDRSGCGCVAPGTRPVGLALALALAALALVLLRRRR